MAKLAKSSVGYEAPAKGSDHCSECRHFDGHSSCAIVAGTIRPQDWCRRFMPYDEVMPKFGKGMLHSGSKSGPKVTNQKQAVAIMLSEKRKAQGGKKEYQSKKKGFTI